MLGLVAVLWAVYLSECLVRWKPGDWVFRRTVFGRVAGVNAPDVTFWNERFAFVWTSPWPAATVRRFRPLEPLGPASLEPLESLKPLGWLRGSAVALFLLLLVVFPALVITGWLLPWVAYLTIAVIVAWISTFVAYLRAHRRIHGCRPPLESWLTNLFSPVSLVRAPQVVSVDVACATHPLIAAQAFCDDEEFLRIARLFHFDDERLRERIERLVKKRGLEGRLLAPPAMPEAGVTRFCRRCHATFKDAAQVCADCRNVVLTPLKQS